MSEEEKIKKFDGEQLEILLNDLQDIDKFTGFKDGTFKYELGKYQANLLINYINKYKEVINKLRELIGKHYFKQSDDYYDYFTEGVCLQDGDYQELEDILKEVE